jgi:hypothetical protein
VAALSPTGQRAWPVAALLFGVTLFVYLYNIQYRYWGAGGDTTPAELLPLSLMGDGDLFLDEFVKVGQPLPFWFTRVNGRVVSSYPIVPGFFNMPAYWIAVSSGVPLDSANRAKLSMMSASVIAAASVVFFYLAALRIVGRRTALAAALLYAFGTTVFSVAARGMWQHGPSLLFLTIALWLLTRSTGVTVALAGLFLGFAVFNRPVNILIVAPLAVFVALRHPVRITAAFLGCAAVPAALMSWYSLVHWGSALNLGQYAVAGTPYDLFSAQRLLTGAAGLLFSPSRGLFVFTPVFLFSFVAMASLLRHPRRQPLLTALSAGVLLTIPMYATWFMWWGGTCFGYRLLTELVPALVLLVAWGWQTMPRWRAARTVIVMTVIFSLYTNFLGAYYHPCGFDTIPNEINAHPERLWSVRDGELMRCSSKFFARIASRF